jgi:hypothetical protein
MLQGVVDENTLVWGQGLIDWLPMRNVKLLVAQVRTPEGECATGLGVSVRLGFRFRVEGEG